MLRLMGWLIAFGVIWLLLSGIYKPITLSLGAASCLLVLFVFHRMEQASPSGPILLHIKPLKHFGYLAWLTWQIAVSTWSVTKVILSPSMPIRQHFFRVKSGQKHPVGKMIFANSITLTPGTITVEAVDDYFYVHALQFDDGDMDDLKEMDRRVCDIEVKS